MSDNIKPRFKVAKLSGKVDHTVYKFEKGKGLVPEVKKEDAGYMVTFPRGSSIRVRTQKELKRLGFDRDAEHQDMETGEIAQ